MVVKISLQPDQIMGTLHPHLYGANLEHLGQSIYGGVWAEMLKERKFAASDRMYMGLSEGLTQQHPSYGVVHPWEAVNPDYQNVLFVHDNTTFYTGAQSQRITIRKADGLSHGIQQRGLYLQAERPYQIRLVLRGEGQAVTIQLGDQAWQLAAVPTNWTTFTHTLTPTKTELNGALQITITRGSLWIGSASLMPADHLNGFRPDVIAALKEWQPTFIRYPGGNFASAYHWMKGVGNRDRRPSYFDPARQAWESNDVGTDEIVELCRMVGSEPILTINMGDGVVAEAAAWVEYCNGGPETKFGAIRANNGHRDPYNIKTWFVGNEQFGNWQVGHCDAETYARRFLEFAHAMRAVDPDLRLIAVGVPTDLYGHWNELVLKTAAQEMDALSVHYYSIRTEKWERLPSDEQLYLPKVAASHEVALMLDKTLEIIAAHSKPPVPLAFDAWNLLVAAAPPDFYEEYAIVDAIYTGAVMNACLQRCDRIVMSGMFNLINAMGNYRVTPQQVWKTPSTLVLELFTHHRGKVSIGCQVTCPTMSTPEAGNLPAFEAIPMVDAAATYDPDTKKLYLSVVNRNAHNPAEIELEGIQRTGAADVYMVCGAIHLSLNTERYPTAVFIEQGYWDAEEETLYLPPHSINMICLTLA